ncbi:hypothetical protein AJ80_08601 [Polytolypa hystricis UAMH7299]|uniref:RNA-dependent RNA polymerase n=1 Tax=Polytolypa hystricis (strain UAMH7299) TaxID=1447883 RepID=A0A2B7X4T5_POLH7|nr:hypothetical protein AJ80_08601 [Polytolypa hystricis UAMH7299]
MEIFCRNIPEQVHEKHLEKEFTPVLAAFKIYTFHCRRLPKRNALLTISDITKAERLLARYGQDEKQTKKPAQLLRMFGRVIYLSPGKNAPDEFFIRHLNEKEEKRLTRRLPTIPAAEGAAVKRVKSFYIMSMSCGMWDYAGSQPLFLDCFRLGTGGNVRFGKTALRITLENRPSMFQYHLEFAYGNILSIYLGAPAVVVTSDTAPRLYVEEPMNELTKQMEALFARNGVYRKSPKKRVGHFGGEHEAVAGTCFTYRFLLRDPRDIARVRDLRNERYIPPMSHWSDYSRSIGAPYKDYMERFDREILKQYVPYRIKFQFQKLVWNGVLAPMKALHIFPYVQELVRDHGVDVVVTSLSRFALKMQFPAPDVDHEDVEVPQLMESLASYVENIAEEHAITRDGNDSSSTSNNILVHRIHVTPCATYLVGPSLEAKNRVLRKYAGNIDNFLRVEFIDETGEPVRYDPKSNLDDIYHGRFKGVLKKGLRVGGRLFQFLGFSHSSLRSQTCWFVSQFVDENATVCDARTIIDQLGYFGHIFSPAKQAARIGQTFSDTLTSISISPECVMMDAPDVERNGRVFSDGVGTLSKDVMYKIWKEYAGRAKVKPTVFQIRFAGAKGMVSLDSTKKGESLMLRKSMVKFPAKDSWNIEICGSGIQKLPFYLNQQIIKILEDLGVAPSAFLKLQQDEITRLQDTMKSTAQAARFLGETSVAKCLRLEWVLQLLEGFDLNYRDDAFLRNVMELAVLVKLRDLKYRARIRVPNAVTLYGIMDETGILKAHQIFCPILSDSGHREILVRENVVITRSPAMHPGDVQLVDAVDVPEDSPLRKLHNCVVFSKWGDRDLPSMLSGGDLDGDLYNIIYDTSLLSVTTYQPADYPRPQEVVLDRQVTKDDIVEFFILFMQQDQLGRIATVHQALADQRPGGTLHLDCLKLAELHSVAVDFSKSGNPVDLTLIPRFPRYRPDFMTPNPRVHIAESISVLEEQDEKVVDDDDDEEERQPMKFYKSEKVLGHLFRAIDEQAFLKKLQDAGQRSSSATGTPPILQSLLAYVGRETQGFVWDHHIEEAHRIKEIYDDDLWRMMHDYSATPWKSYITETEICAGSILGQGEKIHRKQKEASKTMRDEYESLVSYIKSRIRDTMSGGDEALERSIACFYVSMFEDPASDTSKHKKSAASGGGRPKLFSFPWIAAIVCLGEVDRLQRMMPFS